MTGSKNAPSAAPTNTETAAAVSKRMLERHGADFDAWYAVWHQNVDRELPEWSRVTVVLEDGRYKLDEN